MPTTPTPVVVHRSRWRIALRIAAVALLVLAAGLLFEYGRYRGGYDVRAEAAARDALAERIVELTAERDALKRRLAGIEQASRVDRQAYESIKQQLADEQAEIQELRQQVGFYRSIVNDGDLHRGLYIQNLQVQPDGDGGYRYRLILTRYMDRKRRAQGRIVLVVDGRRDGRPSRIEVKGAAKQNRFRFRYFQEVAGQLSLPAGFAPERIVVRAIPTGKGHGPVVERIFAWNELFSEG